MMFTLDILEMLFEETEQDFDAWADQYGYSDQMSDQDIYRFLPQVIKDILGEFDLNASWMHDGM